MDHEMEHHDHSAAAVPSTHAGMNEECDGTIMLGQRGTWMGHVLPGAVFIIWGSFWACNVCADHLRASARRPYHARSWYSLPLPWLRLAEPILKIVTPLVAISIELYFDHTSFVALYCPPGTRHAGRFAVTHMSNWQHTASYPGFILSGVVDLLHAWVPFPQGTGHATLALGFGAMTFLMGTHEKHEPLDKMVHWLLFVAMLLCLLSILAELHARRSPLAGIAKSAALLLQGAWLVQVGRIEYEEHPEWSPDYSGGVMFAPVAFCMIGVVVAGCIVALYTLLCVLRSSGAASFLQPNEDGFMGMHVEDNLGLKANGSGGFDNDSAHDSAGNSGSGSPSAGVGRRMAPFRIMDGAGYSAARTLDV